MKENFIKLSHDLIFLLVCAAAFVLPLFFLPTTSEFFEFNKFTALFIITILALVLWGLSMVLEKKAAFTRTPLDIPLLILLGVFFVASTAGIDQYVSLFGSPGRPWPSFIGLATLVALYFAAVSNLKTRKQTMII